MEVASNEVSRLDLIIAQFLRALRPSKPKLALTRLEQVLEETLALLKEEIQNRGIEVALEVEGAAPPRIRVDRNQMKQAFFNVIRNAFEAMPDGGSLKITVSASDRYVGIEFKDTGVGIRPEDFGRIVQDHGGQLEVASKPEKGTRFTILLPLAERRMRLLEEGGAAKEA